MQRAARFEIAISVEQSELQTVGNAPLSVFQEGSLRDMITEIEDSTFKLCKMHNQSFPNPLYKNSISLENAKANQREEVVFIRWITLEDSLVNAQITSIKVDHAALLRNAPLSELHGRAVDKFIHSKPGTVDGQINLCLKDSYLAAENNPVTSSEISFVWHQRLPT